MTGKEEPLVTTRKNARPITSRRRHSIGPSDSRRSQRQVVVPVRTTSLERG